MSKIIIEGYLATENKKPFLGQVSISKKTGLVTEVSKGRKNKNPDVVYDKDNLIFAGMGDIHIHAREDQTGKQLYKESYQTSGDAALGGGVSHCCAMPNTPKPLTTQSDFKWHRNRIKKLNHPVSLFNYIGIDTKTKPLGKPGEHFYKLYFGKSVGDLTVTYASDLDTILARYKKHNVSFHVEYEPIIQQNKEGRTHSDRRPVAAINEGLRLLLPLIEKHKINAKLCHWSTGLESFDLIKEYQKRGCKITLEVSPLHLLFNTEMTDKDPSLWLKIQMNPAIQSSVHTKELLKGLKEGFIDYLATDHAPHTIEEKYSAFSKYANKYPKKTNQEIAEAIKKKDRKEYLAVCEENGFSGAPWLDVYGLVCCWLMNDGRFTPQDIARVASANPGEFVNPHIKRQFSKGSFGKGFGKLQKGYIGNLTILNTKKKTKVTKDQLKSQVGWSPLEGRIFKGAVESVFIRGEKMK